MGHAPSWLALGTAQQLILLEDLASHGSAIANIAGFARIRGQADEGALVTAARLAVGESDALRLRFSHRGGDLVQRIVDEPDFEVATASFADVTAARAHAELLATRPLGWVDRAPLDISI